MTLQLCSIPDEVVEPQPMAFRETEAARMVGLGIQQFRRYVRAGLIQARVEPLGRCRLYLRSDLAAFLNSLPVDKTAIKP